MIDWMIVFVIIFCVFGGVCEGLAAMFSNPSIEEMDDGESFETDYIELHQTDEKLIYLNPNHILAVYAAVDATVIIMPVDATFTCTESVKEVLEQIYNA